MLRICTRSVDRQDHTDARAFAFLALDLQPASVLPDNLIDKVQAYPGPGDSPYVARAIIPFADPIELVAWDAHPTVLDEDLDEAVLRARRERDHTTVRRVFKCIREQVAEYLIQKFSVARNLGRKLANVRLQTAPETDLAVVARQVPEHTS